MFFFYLLLVSTEEVDRSFILLKIVPLLSSLKWGLSAFSNTSIDFSADTTLRWSSTKFVWLWQGWLIYLHKQFSSRMCLPFKCQYKQLAETSHPKPHNCSQYLEFRMACHVWKGWEGFGRFGGALVNSTDCLAVLNGFVGSAVTNLYFCNTYLCCFNVKVKKWGQIYLFRQRLLKPNNSYW